MKVYNNSPKGKTLYYKVNGVTKKVQIKSFSFSDELVDLTDENQILFNFYDRKIRHIEETTGKQLRENFVTPDEPDYIGFKINASSSVGGTIAPKSVVVAAGESVSFTMKTSSAPSSFFLTTNTNFGGNVTPNGNNIALTAPYYLSGFTVDSVSKITGVTGNYSGTSNYNMSNILANHSLVSGFGVTPTGQTFTFTAATPTPYTYTASTTGNGTISPSGNSLTTYQTHWLSAAVLDGASIMGSITGNVSGTSYYAGSFNKAQTLVGNFSYYSSAVTLTMTATAENHLSGITRSGVSVLSAVTGSISGTSYYSCANILDSTTNVVAMFGVNGG